MKLAVLVCALVATACSKRPDEPTKQATAASTAAATAAATVSASSEEDDGDALVIEKLRAAGSNLNVPVPVDFYLYLPTSRTADYVARAMRKDGYLVDVQPPDSKIPAWACAAKKTIVLTPQTMHEIRAKLTELAEEAGGTYDGWEAPLAH